MNPCYRGHGRDRAAEWSTTRTTRVNRALPRYAELIDSPEREQIRDTPALLDRAARGHVGPFVGKGQQVQDRQAAEITVDLQHDPQLRKVVRHDLATPSARRDDALPLVTDRHDQ